MALPEVTEAGTLRASQLSLGVGVEPFTIPTIEPGLEISKYCFGHHSVAITQ
ncbi:hypothetical protein I79_000672 [Cricetulus griseus]|uniref:Uncharacterized protein n=1 Tax=Cricetulus griseus TaxID=10029 RepID=G3GSQ4_CRIGR|nr:hypothetical protein I79_000672 [Cricetulus griseus]